jgi:hypothetical protein
VTAEVAGSSPVVPAIIPKDLWNDSAPENNKKSNCVRGNRRVPYVRPTCPGVPRGVRGPKMMGAAQRSFFLSESLLVRTQKGGLSLVGAPCFSRGSWTSVQRKAVHLLRTGFSPGFSRPMRKRTITTLRSTGNSSWKRWLAFSNKFVISTGAYPDFLPRSTGQGRVCAFL